MLKLVDLEENFFWELKTKRMIFIKIQILIFRIYCAKTQQKQPKGIVLVSEKKIIVILEDIPCVRALWW